MNQRIDFTKNGGFPATQFMTNFMQESYRAAFMSLAALVGDKVVLQGMQEIGGQVTNGWISVGGELMPFTGGPLVPGAAVIITETVASRVFDDGNPKDVYFTKQAALGTPGAFPYSDLKRIDNIRAIFEALVTLQTAFNGHTHTWDSITGKPANYISYKGSFNIGDIGTSDVTFTVAIPNQGVNTYVVLGSFVGNDNNYNQNNDIIYPNVYDKQLSSFKIGIREINPVIQNVRYEYAIIR